MADPLDDFIVAAAVTLQLPLEPEWQAAVKANLAVYAQARRHGRRIRIAGRGRARAGVQGVTHVEEIILGECCRHREGGRVG